VDEAQKIAANYGSSDIVIATKNPIEKDLQQLKNFGLSVRRLSIKIE
jgi:hypothetical protein